MSDIVFPKVTLKLATSMDGRIATRSGHSQWITGAESRTRVHELRAQHDVVLVGSGTALADDPMLTVRLDPEPTKQPIRMVVDSSLRTPMTHKLVTTAREYRTILVSGLHMEEEDEIPFVAEGVEVWSLAIAPAGGVSIRALLARCAEEGIESIFLEGGGKLAASFLKANMVDHIEWFRAPIVIGGDGIACLASLEIESLNEVSAWERIRLEVLGEDVWESFSKKL
ncbi:RibD family protein [Hirschia baltica]|uniref:RibD family protein n=1 Tax=Hirschia baltica TaxID=2724 RepID=UPI00059DE911|nr:RibD family protein [Hirschia baltica]